MSTTTGVIVARGRSIQVGERLYLPGELAPVPAEDVERLTAAGFVHDPDGVVIIRTAPRQENNPSNIGLQRTTDGGRF